MYMRIHAHTCAYVHIHTHTYAYMCIQVDTATYKAAMANLLVHAQVTYEEVKAMTSEEDKLHVATKLSKLTRVVKASEVAEAASACHCPTEKNTKNDRLVWLMLNFP